MGKKREKNSYRRTEDALASDNGKLQRQESGYRGGIDREKKKLVSYFGQDADNHSNGLRHGWLVLLANLGENDLVGPIGVPPQELILRLQPRSLSPPARIKLLTERMREELLYVLGPYLTGVSRGHVDDRPGDL